VRAVDRGTPPLTGYATVYVSILDINDSPPYFEPAVPEGRVPEHSVRDTPVQLLGPSNQLKQITFDLDDAPNKVWYYTEFTHDKINKYTAFIVIQIEEQTRSTLDDAPKDFVSSRVTIP